MVRAIRVRGELTHRAGDMRLDYAMRTRDKFAKWVHQEGLIWDGEFTVFANGTQPGALTEEEAEQDRRAGCYDGLVEALEGLMEFMPPCDCEAKGYVLCTTCEAQAALAEARKAAPQ